MSALDVLALALLLAIFLGVLPWASRGLRASTTREDFEAARRTLAIWTPAPAFAAFDEARVALSAVLGETRGMTASHVLGTATCRWPVPGTAGALLHLHEGDLRLIVHDGEEMHAWTVETTDGIVREVRAWLAGRA